MTMGFYKNVPQTQIFLQIVAPFERVRYPHFWMEPVSVGFLFERTLSEYRKSNYVLLLCTLKVNLSASLHLEHESLSEAERAAD